MTNDLGYSPEMQAEALADMATQLVDVANRCCSCGAVLPFGGHWGWHAEGYRVGPFCVDCTHKPNIVREVDDPSLRAALKGE